MFYYNIDTHEIINRSELKALYPNKSLALDLKSIGKWYLLVEDEMPVPTASKKVVKGEIKKIDGTYTQTWNLQDLTVEEKLEEAKRAREEAVRSITVTVDGMIFDGNEVSQERMARAVTAAKSNGKADSEIVTWVLANNTVAQVTIGQLGKALLAASQEQTALWTAPYAG